MKFACKLLFIAVIASFMMTNSGCKGKKPEPEPITDQQLEKLIKNPWKVQTVLRNNIDVTSPDYSGFTLTMSGTKGNDTFSYTTAGRPSLSPWAANGTFKFDGSSPSTTLNREDGLPVTYTFTATTLTMSFQYNGSGIAARTGLVDGFWVYTFIPQ